MRNPGLLKDDSVIHKLVIKTGAPITSTSLYFKFKTDISNVCNYLITRKKLHSGALKKIIPKIS